MREEAEVRTCPCGAEFEAAITVVSSEGRGERRVGPTRCPDCLERERVGEVEPVLQEVDPVAALEALGVNVRRHGHLRLDEIDGNPARLARGFVESVLEAGRTGSVDGLYLHGPTGTGKSQIAVSVVRALIERGIDPHRIVYDNARAVVTQLQDRYGTNTVDEFTERRRKALLWVYEDAGTEKLTPDAYRVVEQLLDRREGHPNVWTSNLSRPQLAQKWAELDTEGRLRSRLAGFRSLEVGGADRRFDPAA